MLRACWMPKTGGEVSSRVVCFWSEMRLVAMEKALFVSTLVRVCPSRLLPGHVFFVDLEMVVCTQLVAAGGGELLFEILVLGRYDSVGRLVADCAQSVTSGSQI